MDPVWNISLPAGVFHPWRRAYEKRLVSSPWIKFGLAAGIALLISGLLAVRYFYRRFHKIRIAVEALDPHLLSARVDHNIVITDVTEALCNATGFQTHDLVGKPLIALGSPVTEKHGSMDSIWKTLEKGHTC